MLVVGLLVGAGLGYFGHSTKSAAPVTVTSTATGLSPAPVTTTTTSTQFFTTSTTQTVTTTNVQFVTVTTIVTTTSTSTVTPRGSVAELSGATEVIPSGQKSIVLPTLSFPYDGSLVITYTATNAVSISYNEGSATIASPNSETANGVILPVEAGSPQISVLNGSCPLIGSCPSITMTLSITYDYP